MKKLLLFLVLIFTTLNVHAKWVKVVTNDEADFYVKTDSIKRKGYIITVWEMTNYKSTKTADGIPYLSLKMKSEVNCDTEENRILFIAPYSENMGLGKSLEHIENFNKSFTTIVPDTIAHAIFKFVCSKK
jgi:hypothetical protein